MDNTQILKKLFKQTKRDEITWTRHFKKVENSDPRLNVYYECKLKADNAVRCEYDEEEGLTLSFFDIQTKGVYKKITGRSNGHSTGYGSDLYKLYELIQSKGLL